VSTAHSAEGIGVFEQRLSYAQCWEDPAVLQEALAVGEDDDVLSICSAGDNSFALAIAGARSVTAIDLSLPQLATAELKLAAIQALPPEGVYTLLGLNEFGRRVFTYHQLKDRLSEDTRRYWDLHEDTLRLGLLGQGKFEQYLAAFRTRLLPLVHRRRTVEAMMSLSDLDAQEALFRRSWDTLRWRGLFRVFFSRTVMARSGRSQAHFRYVDGPVSAVFLERARHVLTRIPASTNPFLQWILLGAYTDLDAAHPYLSHTGQAALRQRADRIRFVHADLESFLTDCPPGSFSAFNYSNLFEYLSEEQHTRLLELTVRAARPGARIAYWNLLVPRARPDALADRLERHPQRAADLLSRDRAFVYGGLQIETVR
jgi:S-adenosylmethionine-diacylglycerol 3-amino-3-carboxypropyl transferase